jgi:hypothetical protein
LIVPLSVVAIKPISLTYFTHVISSVFDFVLVATVVVFSMDS